MTIELITGKAGVLHVDSEDVGAYQACTYGAGAYVLRGLGCAMANANTAHVGQGELLIHGRHVRIMGGGEDVAVENGTQAQKRNDLVVLRYERGDGGIESAKLVCLKGTPSATAPTDPAVAAGSILDGDDLVEVPLYRIPLDGLAVGEPVSLISPASPFVGHGHAASDIASGTLPIARGGTGAGNAGAALASLGALPTAGGTMTGALRFANDVFLFGTNSSGVISSSFEAKTSDNRTAMGYGGYAASEGNTSIYGAGVMVQSKKNIEIYNDAGAMYKNGQVLWGGKVLYANDTGSAGTITLTENAVNFTMLEIFYKTNDDGFQVAKVYAPSGKTADLMGANLKSYTDGGMAMYFKLRRVRISGTSISNAPGLVGESSTTNSNSCSAWAGDVVLITKVVGYA